MPAGATRGKVGPVGRMLRSMRGLAYDFRHGGQNGLDPASGSRDNRSWDRVSLDACGGTVVWHPFSNRRRPIGPAPHGVSIKWTRPACTSQIAVPRVVFLIFTFRHSCFVNSGLWRQTLSTPSTRPVPHAPWSTSLPPRQPFCRERVYRQTFGPLHSIQWWFR